MAATRERHCTRNAATSPAELPGLHATSSLRRCHRFSGTGRGAALLALLAVAACNPEAVAPGDPHGTVQGRVTLAGKGVPGIAMFKGGDNEEYPVQAGADGSYSFDLPPGFWTAWARVDNALCVVTGATVEDGKQVHTDLPCVLYEGRYRKKHHQTRGTCNAPVPDFEATLAVATRLAGGRTLMDVTYDGGNENTVVSGEVDSENTFRGASGFDDAGNGATVQEQMVARFELQLDGTIVFTGTSTIEFRVNGAAFCTKEFEISGTKTGS